MWAGLSAATLIAYFVVGSLLVPSCAVPLAPAAPLGVVVLLSLVGYPLILNRAGVGGVGRLVALVLLLAVLAGGVLIAYVNLFDAVDRGKQKRTMQDMRTMAETIEVYLRDHPGTGSARSVRQLNEWLGTTFSETDQWCGDYVVRWNGSHYLIRSLGKDGVRDPGQSDENPTPGVTVRFNDDIVFVDGQFWRYPAGSQQ